MATGMLYEPAQFEPLIDDPWMPARVEDAIAAIASLTRPPSHRSSVRGSNCAGS